MADAYGGCNGVVAGNAITRAGCWAHLRRRSIDAEKVAPEIAREAIEMIRLLYAVEKQARGVAADESRTPPGTVGSSAGANTPEAFSPERAVAAKASHG